MKHSLNISSDRFLTAYSLYRLDPETGFPIISLKMLEKEGAPCPFVTPEGCSIYSDRPTACRLFPLGRASAIEAHQPGGAEEFFFLLDIPGCQGFESEQNLSIKAFLRDQDLTPYLTMNNQMLSLIFHERRDRKKPLSDRQLQNIIVSCYNLDMFKEYIFETVFLQTVDIPAETLNQIKQDDEALLNFAFDYLRQVLFP